jgi:hypothetical protein
MNKVQEIRSQLERVSFYGPSDAVRERVSQLLSEVEVRVAELETALRDVLDWHTPSDSECPSVLRAKALLKR